MTRALMGTSTVLTLAANFLSNKDILSLSLDHIIHRHEYWRILTCQICVGSPGELIIIMLMLYQFRYFERTYGTTKFSAALIYYTIGSLLLQILFILIVKPAQIFPAGPFAVVYGLLVQYWLDVPKTAASTVLGFPVSEKSFTYLLAAQAALLRSALFKLQFYTLTTQHRFLLSYVKQMSNYV